MLKKLDNTPLSLTIDRRIKNMKIHQKYNYQDGMITGLLYGFGIGALTLKLLQLLFNL